MQPQPIRHCATLVMAGMLVGCCAASAAKAQAPLAPRLTSNVVSGRVPYDPLVALGVSDASLRSVASVDVDRVVAVGDRGAILLSESSGRNWVTIPSNTTANLHGVAFVSAELGLIVGGWIGNITRTSHAVILRTLDGGRQWMPVPCDNLPRLTGIWTQGSRCMAWGDYSPNWKSSVFESGDGGLTWNAIPMEIGHANAATMAPTGTIGAIDRLGRACFVDTELQSTNVANPTKPLSCLHHTGKVWLACGEGGELIASQDSRTWTNVAVPLSSAARQLCTWHSIGQFGDKVWICGMPGSILLVSSDRGVTWNLKRTGQSLPLSAIHFADQHRGWATGPMGLILATRDGGETWYPQRQRARRLGVLSVASTPAACPWAPLAAAAWDEQVATAASVFTNTEPLAEADFLPSTIAAHSAIAPQLGLAAHRASAHLAIDSTQFSRQLALELLCWRPDVLLAGEDSRDAGGKARLLVTRALEALAICSSPDASFEEFGLANWSVSKLMETCEPDSSQTTEQSARVLRGPGIAIVDCLLSLPPAARLAARSTSLRTVWAQSQSSAASTALLGAIAPSDATARQVALRDVGNFQMVLGRVHREKTMELLATTTTDESSLQQWTDSLDFVLQTLPKREVAAVLHDLACRLSSVQNWEQRKSVYQRLIDSAPTSDAADWARFEQLTLDSSDEIRAWKNSSKGDALAGLQIASEPAKPRPIPGKSLEPWLEAEASNATPFGHAASKDIAIKKSMVVPASSETPTLSPPALNRSILPSWLQVVQQTTRDSAALLARPDMRLLMNRAEQRWPEFREQNTATSNHLIELISANELVGWPQMAKQELAIQSNQTGRLRWKITAVEAKIPPVLDGELNDPCWSEEPGMVLESFVNTKKSPKQQSSSIRWSFDQDYLYVGISCPQSMGTGVVQLADHRDYDADLRSIDHVEFTLDTDRDYCTAIELAVSADGRTYDRCCGFTDFNPKWHVCVKSTADKWIAEIAIKLSALTTETDLHRQPWAVSARRIIPGAESQSWSQLRSHQAYLQAGGLLLFAPQPVTSSLTDR